MKSLIRWGIIGCGDVTEVKSGPALQKAEGSALVAVMRRDAGRAQDYAQRHGVPRWYADADQLINDGEVDAVYIATPPETHEHYAMRVLACGKPCYVEKPMARNHAECVRMVEAFRAEKVPLFVAYYRRGLARFNKVKEIVDAGRLGQLSHVSIRYAGWRWREAAGKDNMPWRLKAEIAGGGFFMDLASHTLDVLDYILGPLENVAGHAANVATPVEVEDNVAMSFGVVGRPGLFGTGYWNFAAGVRDDLIEITGTHGRVALSTFGNEPVQLVTAEGTESFDLPNPPHIQQPLIQTIVHELLGRDVCPSTGETGAHTSRVLDEALKNYYGGREDGFWKRAWPGRRNIELKPQS